MSIKNGVDDLGFPVMTRREMAEKMSELGSSVDPSRAYDSQYMQFYYEEAIATGLFKKVKQPLSLKKYAVTLTTAVDKNGKPKKDYYAFKACIQRIFELSGVKSIDGVFELTKQGALHVHMLVHTTAYLDSGKVRRCNANENVCVKGDRKYQKVDEGWSDYMSKSLTDPELLRHLGQYNVTTPRFSFP